MAYPFKIGDVEIGGRVLATSKGGHTIVSLEVRSSPTAGGH